MNFESLNTHWFVALVITVLLLAVAHWFPWPWWNGRKLPRLATYSIGGLCLLIGASIYLYSIDPYLIAPIALLFGIAGLAVYLFWGLDRIAVNINKGRNGQKRTPETKR